MYIRLANDNTPPRNRPALSRVFPRFLLFFSLIISSTIRNITSGTASTTSNSVSEIGISDVKKPIGTVMILNSHLEHTYSVNAGKYGSKKYIDADNINGINIHATLKNFFIAYPFSKIS